MPGRPQIKTKTVAKFTVEFYTGCDEIHKPTSKIDDLTILSANPMIHRAALTIIHEFQFKCLNK
jgi:hypothetical protein